MLGLLMSTFSSQAAETQDEPKPRIQWGTQVEIRLKDRLTTRRDEMGETFEAELVDDLYHRRGLIAPAGSRVRGEITHLQEGQRRPEEQRAEMELRLTEIRVDGHWYPIQSQSLMFQTDRNFTGLKIMTPAMAGLALGGLKGGAAGSLIGLGWAVITKDRQIVLRRNTELEFRLKRPGKLRRQVKRHSDCGC